MRFIEIIDACLKSGHVGPRHPYKGSTEALKDERALNFFSRNM